MKRYDDEWRRTLKYATLSYFTVLKRLSETTKTTTVPGVRAEIRTLYPVSVFHKSESARNCDVDREAASALF
jgi:hypothetical protein